VACGAGEVGRYPISFTVASRSGTVLGGTTGVAEGGVTRRAGEQCAYYTARLSVAPGDYVVRFVAGTEDGRIGGVEHPVAVRLIPAAPYEIASLILTDPAVELGGQPRLLVGRETSAARLGVHAEITVAASAGAASEVDAPGLQFEIVAPGRDAPLGAVAALAEPGAAPGRWSADATFAIGTLPPGEYIARASVFDAGRVVGRASHAFRVAAPAAAR
jgi:hypothetical protein